MTETINAFIPLKGHSARVPGKNLRDFNGRPLFHAIVETLQIADRVGMIYIDTDSADIAHSAAALDDVIVIDRRLDLVGDEVSVNRLIGAFLDIHDDADLIQTHATNPVGRTHIKLAKGPKSPSYLLRRHADPGILDLGHQLLIDLESTDLNRSACECELDGIVDQIGQDLLETPPIEEAITTDLHRRLEALVLGLCERP